MYWDKSDFALALNSHKGLDNIMATKTKTTEFKLRLGTIDGNLHGYGPGTLVAEITWTFRNGRFSMCAGLWSARQSDYVTCGQCIDSVADLFPDNAIAQRMRAIWERWHLNDMRAGSPAQSEWLRANPIIDHRGNYYDIACARLKDAGLNPDPNYLRNGLPYSYGHAWLLEVIPDDVVAEIETWSMLPTVTSSIRG